MIVTKKTIICEAIKSGYLLNIFVNNKKDFLSFQKMLISNNIKKYDSNTIKYLNKPFEYKYYAKIKNLKLYDKETLYKNIECNFFNIVVLDKIHDPQNFGSIIRNCHGHGFKNIVISANNQVNVTEAVVNASAGSIFYVKIYKVNSLSSFVTKLKKYYNFWIYCATTSSDSKSIFKVNFNNPYCVIFGNEYSGISQTLLKMNDEKFTIPISNNFNSFNVSASIAMTLFYLNNKNKFNK